MEGKISANISTKLSSAKTSVDVSQIVGLDGLLADIRNRISYFENQDKRVIDLINDFKSH